MRIRRLMRRPLLYQPTAQPSPPQPRSDEDEVAARSRGTKWRLPQAHS
jgi:hypothetical protein